MSQTELTLVLVMPPQGGLLNGFATGLISIANYVQAQLPSVQVQLFDMSEDSLSSLEETILHKGISFARNTVVGITTTTASYQAALAVASAFKNLSRSGVRFTTVLGGHHVSADAEVVLKAHPGKVDYIIVGEGEIAMAKFLQTFPNVCKTPGLAFLHNGNFQNNPPSPLLDEQQLNSIPITFRDHVADRGFLGTPGKFNHVTYVSARGCPLKCAFCSVSNQKIRAKSVSRVVEDIQQLVSMGFSQIAIEDNFFAHTAQRTKELCEALVEMRKESPLFSWDCQTRVESMDREGLVSLMQRAGCEAVYLGVESVNPDQLRYLNKTPNPERYLERLSQRVVPSLLESNINCFINLQFGLPGETDSMHAQIVEFLKPLGQEATRQKRTIMIFPMLHVVYPGTEHFISGIRQRKFPHDIFERFTDWESKQKPVLEWLGEHFAHGTGGIPVGILNPDALRSGHFDDDTRIEKAVIGIDNVLNRIGRLDGIEVFKYGQHLVPINEVSESFTLAHAAND